MFHIRLKYVNIHNQDFIEKKSMSLEVLRGVQIPAPLVKVFLFLDIELCTRSLSVVTFFLVLILDTDQKTIIQHSM